MRVARSVPDAGGALWPNTVDWPPTALRLPLPVVDAWWGWWAAAEEAGAEAGQLSHQRRHLRFRRDQDPFL